MVEPSETQKPAAHRCETHSIALGPDGRCLLCSRATREAERAESRITAPHFIGLSAALLLGLATLWAVDAWWSSSAPWPERAQASVELSALMSQEPPSEVASLLVPEELLPDAFGRSPLLPPRRRVPPPTQEPEEPMFLEDAPSFDEVQRRRERLPYERVSAEPSEPEPYPPSRDRPVLVVMYSASWCGVCRSARAYMDRMGIDYVEHDVDEDPAARARQRALNPGGGLPTFDIEGEVLVGFSPSSLQAAIRRARALR